MWRPLKQQALLDLCPLKSGEREGGSISLGTTVCFTGALKATIDGYAVTRDQAHEFARGAGLVVLDSVTKKLEVLVVADPQSASGKAKKARSYGTRIIAEAVFWQVIGIPVDQVAARVGVVAAARPSTLV